MELSPCRKAANKQNNRVSSGRKCTSKFLERGNIQSASSYARPAPKPRPTQAGQALRLKSRTERTTPKPRPMEERTIKDEMARSHYEFKDWVSRNGPIEVIRHSKRASLLPSTIDQLAYLFIEESLAHGLG